ncbi:MAG: hypothetical protein GY830_10810 [Bacteroidetes bacterium]|nr:hypothetical protein [Bacteroidota bacterium]
MISDEELKKNYGKNYEETDEKKYKWYLFINQLVINKEVILEDDFWSWEEKKGVAKVLNNEKVEGVAMYSRVFMQEHLDVIIIFYRRKFFYEKSRKNEKEKN